MPARLAVDAGPFIEGELAPAGDKDPVLEPGGSGAGLNRLPIPLTTTPGCMPRNGVSKLIVPKILWRKRRFIGRDGG